MKQTITSSLSESRGSNIDGVGLRIETWNEKQIHTTSGEQRNAMTRIRVSFPSTQIFKNLLTHLIITCAITLSIYATTQYVLNDFWSVSVSVGSVYLVLSLTTIILYEDVLVVHGRVLQISTRYLCWPLSYHVHMCESIELVCINEGFRRQRVIFYLMIVMTGRERQKECKVLFENMLPGLDVLKGILGELKGVIKTSESME